MRGAWEQDRVGVDLPVAVHPTYVHSRLRAQHACFTVHGKRKDSLQALVPDVILKRYVIDPGCRTTIRRELMILGVTEAVAYPDLDGLARTRPARPFPCLSDSTASPKPPTVRNGIPPGVHTYG